MTLLLQKIHRVLIFSTLFECIWRHLVKINPFSTRMLLYRHLTAGKPTHGAGISSKPTETIQKIEGKDKPNVTHPCKKTLWASSSDILAQEAHNSISVEVLDLHLTQSKLSRAARRKLKKTAASQSATNGLVQLGHETSHEGYNLSK